MPAPTCERRPCVPEVDQGDAAMAVRSLSGESRRMVQACHRAWRAARIAGTWVAADVTIVRWAQTPRSFARRRSPDLREPSAVVGFGDRSRAAAPGGLERGRSDSIERPGRRRTTRGSTRLLVNEASLTTRLWAAGEDAGQPARPPSPWSSARTVRSAPWRACAVEGDRQRVGDAHHDDVASDARRLSCSLGRLGRDHRDLRAAMWVSPCAIGARLAPSSRMSSTAPLPPLPLTAPSLTPCSTFSNATGATRSFRPLQREAMDAVLAGRDSLLVLPTGGGKSLCFQAPALVARRPRASSSRRSSR